MDARTKINEQLAALKQDWAVFNVERAWLFGSRASDHFQPESDWDFVVQFSHAPGFEEFMGLRERLEHKLGGRVDLLSHSACKPRFLREIEKDWVDVT